MPTMQSNELLSHVDVEAKEQSAGVVASVCEVVWIDMDGQVLTVLVVVHHDFIKQVALDNLEVHV